MDTIYIITYRLKKIDGGYYYDPCIDPTNINEIKLLACNDLVALQNENIEILDMLNSICDVVIVPVSYEVFSELEKDLKTLLSNAECAINEAVEKMEAAYKVMGIEEFDAEQVKAQMLGQTLSYGNAGKVINDNYQVVDREDNYVIYDEDDDYDEDDEDDYDDFDDDIN